MVFFSRVFYGIAMLICFQAMSVAEEPPKIFEAYNDGAGKVVRLANEDTMPFLFQGRPVMNYAIDDSYAPYMKEHKKQYAKAIKRFPSVRDGLLKSEQKSPRPDLTKFDWRKTTGTDDVAVCVFRVASSYLSPEDMRNWLASQEFRARTLKDPEHVYVDGSWSVEQYAAKSGENIVTKTLATTFAHGFSLTIAYIRDSEPYYVSANITSK